jgi:hypothetical protein
MANGPLRIAYQNYADTALISTGSAAVTSLPAINLLDQDIKKVWRSTSSSGDALIIDLGTSRTIGVVGLLNTNLDLDDIIHVRFSTSDPTGQDGSAYNSSSHAAGVDPVFAAYWRFIEPAATGRYMRIGTTLTATVWEAGRLVIAPTWIPTRHFSFGWAQGREDKSRRDESLGGNMFVDRRPRQRVWEFTLRGLTESEVDSELEPLNRLNGASKDIMVCRDKANANLGKVTVWGMLDQALRPTQEEGLFYQTDFVLRERI